MGRVRAEFTYSARSPPRRKLLLQQASMRARLVCCLLWQPLEGFVLVTTARSGMGWAIFDRLAFAFRARGVGPTTVPTGKRVGCPVTVILTRNYSRWDRTKQRPCTNLDVPSHPE